MFRVSVLLFFLLAASFAWAVDLPDFSFKGEEVASFNIQPAFRDIDLSLSVPSSFTNYTEKQTIDVAADETDNYTAEEPSFFYRFRPTTAIASLFSGDTAYRKYFVKRFLLEDYESVAKAYPDYEEDFKTPEYKEEAYLLYAVSLWNLKDKGADGALSNACLNGKEFRNEACDKYMQILWDRGDYAKITETGDALHRPFPAYTFSAYVLAAFKEKEFSKASKLLADNPDLVFEYADFNDLRAVSEYYKGNYGNVARLAPYCTDNITFIQADSFINLGRAKEAEQLIGKIAGQSDRRYLDAKLKIRLKMQKEAAAALKLVTVESEKMELLNYYAAVEFPRMSSSFLSEFDFKLSEYKDYPAYYEGLQHLELKRYARAAELLAKVQTPPDLVQQAKFYRGMALVYVDPSKAESDIIATMNYSRDPAQVAASRFMLAQVYYMKKQYNEAIQLLDGCSEQYCKQLRGEIDLQRGKYDTAMADVEGIDTPQAHLIRATAYYNKMEYDAARREIEGVKTSSKEFTHLKMMLAFKEGDVKGGTAILTANQSYRPILYDGVKELMLAGDYQLAEKLLEPVKNLPPDMEIVSAKLLAWSGRTKEAKALYDRLIKEKSMVYDAFSGIIALEKNSQGEMAAISSILKELPRTPEFPQKDLLLSQMASKASRAGENVILIQIINMFFPAYVDSPYAGDMYAERARLFYTTGRSQECLRDIADAVEKNSMIAPELRFIKAQCTEAVDLRDALAEYRAMFLEDDQFRLPAAVKIMDLSDKSLEVLTTAEEVRKDNPQLYVEGVRRYVEIAKPAELADNQQFVDSLLKDKSKALKCAGLFAQARMQNENGKGRDAAKTYYQVYQTDAKDHFAAPALDAAITIYTKLKMPEEAAQMDALRKKIKGR